jgi:transposase
MDLVYPRCAGIDVHKRTAVVTVGWVDEQGQRQRKTRTFGTMTAEIEQLAAWLVEHQVTHVAMESTGVYWRPVVRHEALLNREGMRGPLQRTVAAVR